MILVTGANGFVGRAVVAEAKRRGLRVRAAMRTAGDVPEGAELSIAPSLEAGSDWRPLLKGVDAVVHAAARVHVMRDTADDPLAAFRRVNVNGTMELALQAVQAGVRRFVFISSIKVNGEGTSADAPYRADSPPQATDPYGISKLEAERGLLELARGAAMGVAIIRPVLVYGPGVRANFRSVMKWIRRGIPLPLGAIHNRRSLVALDNLVDLILTCVAHPAAANQVFLVSDGEDVSTPGLLRSIAAAMQKRAALIPVPPALLQFLLSLFGLGAQGRRLCGSLHVDIGKTRERLGWTPPVRFDVAIQRTVDDYLASLAQP